MFARVVPRAAKAATEHAASIPARTAAAATSAAALNGLAGTPSAANGRVVGAPRVQRRWASGPATTGSKGREMPVTGRATAPVNSLPATFTIRVSHPRRC